MFSSASCLVLDLGSSITPLLDSKIKQIKKFFRITYVWFKHVLLPSVVPDKMIVIKLVRLRLNIASRLRFLCHMHLYPPSSL